MPFISRAVLETLTAERVQATERAKVLEAQNTHLQDTVEFFRLRMEHLDRERAQLLKRYMDVVVEVPHYVKAEPDQTDIVGGANVFDDVGDTEAKRLGLTWDGRGELVKA